LVPEVLHEFDREWLKGLNVYQVAGYVVRGSRRGR
jgi:hypothetical protein